MVKRRRNTDWDDLPPTFAPAQQPAVTYPAYDLELPPMFYVAPTPIPPPSTTTEVQPWRGGVAIKLDVPPGLDARKELANLRRAVDELVAVGAVQVDPLGEFMTIPAHDEFRVHQAVLSIVGDRGRDQDLRSGALDLVKKIEAATGLHPQQGFFELARTTSTFHLLGEIKVVDLRDMPRRRLSLEGPGARNDASKLIAAFPTLFVREYSAACRDYESQSLWSMYADLDPDDPASHQDEKNHWRHYHAMGAAMHAFRELLEKSGFEASVIYGSHQLETDEIMVLWREPGDDAFARLVGVGRMGSNGRWSPWLTWAEPGFEQAMVHGTAVLEGRDWFVDELEWTNPSGWEDVTEDGHLNNPRRSAR